MRFLIVAGITLVLVIGSLLVAPSFIDWNKYKDQATKQIEAMTGLRVAVKGNVSLTILPSPRIYLKDVVVTDASKTEQTIATFDFLSVRVGLAALFDGRAEISSVHLQKPVVNLIKDSEGRLNVMTPKINALMKGKEVADKALSSNNNFSISFESISIEDGAFLYQDGASKTVIEDIDMGLSAGGLSGPFKGHGAFVLNKRPVSFDMQTGVLDTQAQASSVNLKLSSQDDVFDFAGVVSGGETPSAKGEFSTILKTMVETLPALKDGVSLKGFMDANAKEVNIKDVSLSFAESVFTGSIDTGMAPFTLNASLKTDGAVNIDQLLNSSAPENQSTFPDFGALLPKTLELPVTEAFNASIDMAGVLYNLQRYENVSMKFSKLDKGFKAKVEVGRIPGEGVAQLDTVLSYAETSFSPKTNRVLYSSPVLKVNIKGQTQNMPQMVKAVSGQDRLPLIANSKVGVFDVAARVKTNGLYIDNAVLNLDNDAFSAKGSITPQKGSAKPLMKMSVLADKVNVDELMPKAQSGSIDASKPSGEMPFDLELDATVNKLVTSGQVISGLKAGLRMADNKLVLNRISANDLAGHKLDVDGVVSVDMNRPKPYLSGKVHLGDLVWKGHKGKTASRNGERWSSAPLDNAWLDVMDADLDVAANTINYEGWLMRKPSMSISLKDGIMDVQSLKAGLYGGALDATGRIAKLSGPHGFSIAGKAGVNQVSMEPLVTSLAAGSRLLKGKGLIDLNTDISGSGQSMKAIMASLAGQGGMNGSGILIQGLDVQRFVRALSDEAKPGDTVLNLWKGVATRGGSTQFNSLAGAYALQNGVINIPNLVLDGSRAAIATKGRINLLSWMIETAHTMSVKDRNDIPPFTVNISGPLDDPAQTFAGGALNDFLSRKIQRKLDKVLGDSKLGETLDKKLGLDGVLQGVLGGGAPVRQQAPANDNATPSQGTQKQGQQREVKPEDAVQDLLRGFLR